MVASFHYNVGNSMRKLPKPVFFLLFFVAFWMFAFPVRAEEIQEFRSHIQLEQDGRIQVREDVSYDFGHLNRHGITRFIPVVKKNEAGKRFRMDLKIVSVTDEAGNPYQYSVSTEGDNEVVKIGNPEAYVTGKKQYQITYEVSGAVTYFSDHDELYWNITGNGWPVAIREASYSVSFPQTVRNLDVKAVCYTGSYGTRESSCGTGYESGVILGHSIGPLGAGEGLTASVCFPPGIVAHLEPREEVNFFETFLGKIVLLILGLAALVWYLLLPLAIPFYWWKKGRDPKAEVGEVRAWFDPPQTKSGRPLGPGETGLLVDEVADTRDIFAVIVDLARRGYFKIAERQKGDFHFVKNDKDPTGLREYEKKLLDGLFEDGDDLKVKGATLAGTVANVKKNLYKDLTAEGFFPSNPDTIRTIWIVIGVVALSTANPLLALTSFIFGRAMPKKTAWGAGQANVGRSLKNFLTSQERQLEFQAKNQMFFEKLLPYAIAFGVEKVWADRFKEIDLKNPDWYQGYGSRPFTTGYFIGSMQSSLDSFRSSATPTSSTSGFSSGMGGGGFSGGGGGGGGGGSW